MSNLEEAKLRSMPAKQLQKNLNRKRLNMKKQMSTRWPPRVGRAMVMALSSSRPHRQSCWWYEVSRLHIGQHSYTIMFQEASDLTLVCCDDEVKVQASKAAAEKIDSKDAKSEDGGVARTYAATSRTTCTRVYFTARVMSYCQSIVSSLNIHSLTHVY